MGDIAVDALCLTARLVKAEVAAAGVAAAVSVEVHGPILLLLPRQDLLREGNRAAGSRVQGLCTVFHPVLVLDISLLPGEGGGLIYQVKADEPVLLCPWLLRVGQHAPGQVQQ